MDKEGSIIVAINCMVYNHEPFVRQCLEGFVMQQTNFHFVAIVHDDASTDKSADIIREYAERYPDIIYPIYETENQYSKHDGSLSKIKDEAIQSLNPKYVATCEGDDYWTDPMKLQKQVDFLEKNPEYVMCAHNYTIFEQNTGKTYPCHNYNHREYKQNGAVSYLPFTYYDGWFTTPLTCMVRHADYLYTMPREKFKYFLDQSYYYYVLKRGKGVLLRDIMGVYRVHQGGIYSGSTMEFNYCRSVSILTTIYKLEKDKKILPLLQQYEKGYIVQLVGNRKILKGITELILMISKMPLKYFFTTLLHLTHYYMSKIVSKLRIVK